jgi:N-acetylneuraminic acid mutarotase
VSGKVLIAGGQTSGASALASAELYDPATGRWTATGTLHSVRSGHTATLLPDGSVLVAGGQDGRRMELEGLELAAFRSAERYDPATGMWTTTERMTTARTGHTATLLRDGRVLVAGGDLATGTSAELYDPDTGGWTATDGLTDARRDHASTLLPDGHVLVSGGFIGSDYTIDGGQWCAAGAPPSVCSSERYDPVNGRWARTGELHADRGRHTSTLLADGTVLVIGRGTAADPVPAELYDPGSGRWTITASPSTTRGLTATLLLDGRVLATSGVTGDGRVAELYQPGVGR